jgi:hypothetical protein
MLRRLRIAPGQKARQRRLRRKANVKRQLLHRTAGVKAGKKWDIKARKLRWIEVYGRTPATMQHIELKV